MSEDLEPEALQDDAMDEGAESQEPQDDAVDEGAESQELQDGVEDDAAQPEAPQGDPEDDDVGAAKPRARRPVTEDIDPEKLRGIVEAVLMTAETPVTPGKLQSLVKGVNGRDLRQAVDDLNERYREGGHAMTITEIAGGFQIVTLREFGPWVRKFHDRSQVRLSQAALETLAIIAFKQPVTRIEVDSVRGVDSGGVLRTLMELNMIRIVGRSEGIGRPMLFGTTRDFMTHFGLRSLADLPKPKELEELLAEGERKARAEGLADPEDEETAENGPADVEDVTADDKDGAEADPGDGADADHGDLDDGSADHDAPDAPEAAEEGDDDGEVDEDDAQA